MAERTREQPFTVDGLLLTDVGGTIAVKVLSTPGMIAMMEHNATLLAVDHLADGQATVGFEVCVKHVAGAFEGTPCVARATLTEVVDERKYRFAVEVVALEDGGERTIGVGTHERRVVQGAPA